MSETKWTPGKWVAVPDPNAFAIDDYCVGVEGGDKIDEIATCGERNARLIAASPELYEALANVVAEYDEEDNGRSLRWAVDSARDVLAKARGE